MTPVKSKKVITNFVNISQTNNIPVDDIPDGILVDKVESTPIPYFQSNALETSQRSYNDDVNYDEVFGQQGNSKPPTYCHKINHSDLSHFQDWPETTGVDDADDGMFEEGDLQIVSQ